MDEDEKNLPDDESKSGISSDLIRGHINTIILRTLYERDKYGYEIIEEIEKKSHGQYTIKQPTLYSALKRLETQGYINAYWKSDEVSQGGRRKYFTLTDSGREVSERNQAEWEYSRTVIDNLISDKSFDFTQPPPTAVDFTFLRDSTTRVPTIRHDEEAAAENSDETQEKPEEVAEVKEEIPFAEVVPEPQPVQTELTPAAAEAPEPVVTQPEETAPAMDEEQRRKVHENYLKLISEPVEEKSEPDEMPYADNIDTDSLIYANKPDTERDYKNIINGLFTRTIRPSQPTYQAPTPAPAPVPAAPIVRETAPATNTQVIKVDDLSAKAETDGLKVNTSDYVITGSRKRMYNRGSSLLKSSLIIAIILLLEFTLTLLFRKDLGVALAYPFVILAIAAAQLLIFGVLCYTDIGRDTRKPTSMVYLSACIIVTILLILIIFVIALLLKVNFSSAGDVVAKMIIPCIVAMNIPIFAVCFYLFSR